MGKSLQDQLLEAGAVSKSRAEQLKKEKQKAARKRKDRQGGGNEQARRDASESAAQAPMEAEAPVDASAGEKRGRHDE